MKGRWEALCVMCVFFFFLVFLVFFFACVCLMLFNTTKLLEKMKTAKPPLKQQFNAVSSIKKSPQMWVSCTHHLLNSLHSYLKIIHTNSNCMCYANSVVFLIVCVLKNSSSSCDTCMPSCLDPFFVKVFFLKRTLNLIDLILKLHCLSSPSFPLFRMVCFTCHCLQMALSWQHYTCQELCLCGKCHHSDVRECGPKMNRYFF